MEKNHSEVQDKTSNSTLPRSLFYSRIFSVTLMVALTVLSAYVCYQLNVVQHQLTFLQDKDFSEDIEMPNGLNRQKKQRGLGGQNGEDGPRASTTSGPSGRNGGRASSVVFIHWGSHTCPPSTTSRSLFEQRAATISALHDQVGSVVAGSEMMCVPNDNNIDSQRPVVSGLQLQPVEFNLYGHSRYFDERNKNGYLSCTHCFVETSDVITLIGIECKYPEWQTLYQGFLVSSFSIFGTSQSICVSVSSGEPRPASLFVGSARSVVPIRSGSVPPITPSNKRIPCYVCFRHPTTGLERSTGDGRGPKGAEGSRGAQSAQGRA